MKPVTLRFDPRARTLARVGVPSVVERLVAQAETPVVVPTPAQGALLAVLRLGHLVVLLHLPGAGLLTAAMLHALSTPANRVVKFDTSAMERFSRQDIAVLVLAGSASGVRHYADTMARLVAARSETRGYAAALVQALYPHHTPDSLPPLFVANPHPHVLVATPETVLRMAERSMDTVNLRNLRCLVVDDGARLVDRDWAGRVAMGPKRRMRRPAVEVLKQVLAMRRLELLWAARYKIPHNRLPLQMCILGAGQDAVAGVWDGQAVAVGPVTADSTVVFPEGVAWEVRIAAADNVRPAAIPRAPLPATVERLFADKAFRKFDAQYPAHRAEVGATRTLVPAAVVDECVRQVAVGRCLVVVPEFGSAEDMAQVLAQRVEGVAAHVDGGAVPGARCVVSTLLAIRDLPLPGLATVVALGVDAVPDARAAVELGLMCRDSAGLRGQGRVVHLVPRDDWQEVEQLYAGRVLLRTGVAQQLGTGLRGDVLYEG